MRKINGKAYLNIHFPDSEFVQDIIYYDRPILSLYKLEDRLFLWYWMNTNELMNRWGVFETTMEKLPIVEGQTIFWEDVEDCILNDEVYLSKIWTLKKVCCRMAM